MRLGGAHDSLPHQVRKPAVANAVSANMDCHRGRRRRGAHFEVTPVDISYNFNFCVMVIIIINY